MWGEPPEGGTTNLNAAVAESCSAAQILFAIVPPAGSPSYLPY